MLDEDFFTLNMMINWLKFGFGRASDNVNEELRYGRMTREKGISIVEKFDGNCTDWVIEIFCDFIEISKTRLLKVFDHAIRDISLGHMRREEGIQLLASYIDKKPRHLNMFLEWIGMTENDFHYLIEQHRNSSIWHRNDQWEWELKMDSLAELKMTISAEAALSSSIPFKPFVKTGKKIVLIEQIVIF